MADTNLMALRYVRELEWGTTPAAPLKALRYTSESLGELEESTQSGEIIGDRQLRDTIRTGRGSQGGVDAELSYGTFDELLEAALCGAWTTNVLENGVARHSLTLEKEIVNEAGTSHFLAFKGFRIGTLSLSFSLGAVVTTSFAGMGKGLVPAAATAGAGAPVDAAATEPISVTDISSVAGDEAEIADPIDFTINVDNNLRRQAKLGSVDPRGIGLGAFRASGTLAQYFADRALVDDYIARVAKEFSVEVTDAAGNKYEFMVPKARLGAPEIVNQGQNGDVVARFPWTAIKDAGSTEKSLIISRTPAA